MSLCFNLNKMNSKKRSLDKKLVFQNGSFRVSLYDFTIPNGEKTWIVLSLAELKTIKKKRSEESKSYYTQQQYITVSQEQLISLVETLKM